jgi:hypothetical protein
MITMVDIVGTEEMFSREEIETVLKEWKHSWNNHDLDAVMDLFHYGE